MDRFLFDESALSGSLDSMDFWLLSHVAKLADPETASVVLSYDDLKAATGFGKAKLKTCKHRLRRNGWLKFHPVFSDNMVKKQDSFRLNTKRMDGVIQIVQFDMPQLDKDTFGMPQEKQEAANANVIDVKSKRKRTTIVKQEKIELP